AKPFRHAISLRTVARAKARRFQMSAVFVDGGSSARPESCPVSSRCVNGGVILRSAATKNLSFIFRRRRDPGILRFQIGQRGEILRYLSTSLPLDFAPLRLTLRVPVRQSLRALRETEGPSESRGKGRP